MALGSMALRKIDEAKLKKSPMFTATIKTEVSFYDLDSIAKVINKMDCDGMSDFLDIVEDNLSDRQVSMLTAMLLPAHESEAANALRALVEGC
jgi:hypothetical protein